jgi:chromate reductase
MVEVDLSPQVLLINGSASGTHGNTAVVLAKMEALLHSRASVESLVLVDESDFDSWERRIRAADAFVFATGTYWDSWGWPLQRFLERMTAIEASDAWLGKPAATLVTMHSVGGKGVLSRLQGVLNTLGLMIPPLTGWVYSGAAQGAIQHAEALSRTKRKEADDLAISIADDLWRISDLEVVAHNLLEAVASTNGWKAWPVDRAQFGRRWIDVE